MTGFDDPPGRMNALDWLFRDRRTGEICVAQFPNVALWIVISAIVLRLFVPDDEGAHTLLDVIAAGALAWWSVDEIVRGVNPWRKLLGVVGAGFVVVIVVDLLG
jgi:hypothetical protein